jgi:hypothetical protein
MRDLGIANIIVGALVIWLIISGPAKVATELGAAYRNFLIAAQGDSAPK